ncbi:hypothetical protein A9Q84_16160 [Halobacteriovorax marinus]|mgnify:CR=1 FL=1|uniref:Multidrug-efflux transporter n=1 Tax=Halobacteriovorax marinus TaxID=97084 RepID=A0A1Y5F9N3_9BACT|nr:hypothetical protein A9Q84_16160 [Halobacteriovorax marinus]
MLRKFIKPHYREIIAFSMPILLSMISQNMMGLVDTFLIGKLGTSSLAAAGLSFFILFIHTAPLMGLAIAVQTLSARFMGEGRKSQSASPLNSAIIISIVFGGIVAFVASFYMESLLSFMTNDSVVVREGVSYMDARLIGIFAIGITHSFRGFWNGISRTTIYLGIMIIMHVSNAFISYALIFGKWGAPTMGIAGAGMGSTIATILGAILHFGLASIAAGEHGFSKVFFDRDVWKKLLKQAIPSGLQQFLFALGFFVFFSIIGTIGSNELAAANVLITISLFLIYLGMSMGMTASTFVSRSLGENDRDQARFWGRKIVKFTVIAAAIISIPIMIFPSEILSIFIHDSEVLAIAKWPLIIFAVSLAIDIAGYVYTYKFFGSGDPSVILKVTIPIQWLGILPLSYVVGPVLGYGLTEIWLVQTVFRCLQTLILALIWKKDQWGKSTSLKAS